MFLCLVTLYGIGNLSNSLFAGTKHQPHVEKGRLSPIRSCITHTSSSESCFSPSSSASPSSSSLFCLLLIIFFLHLLLLPRLHLLQNILSSAALAFIIVLCADVASEIRLALAVFCCAWSSSMFIMASSPVLFLLPNMARTSFYINMMGLVTRLLN